MRRSRVVVLSLVLAGVGAGCYKIVGFPCVPYNKPLVIAVIIQKNDKGTCTTRTSPQWQPIKRGDTFIWDVVAADPCAAPKDVHFVFQNSEAVRVTESEGNPRHKEGKAVGVCGHYKYSVLIKTTPTEDPEIEIWP
jgi:hypothetical protein